MTLTEFPGPGLSEAQWGLIRALTVSLTPEQMLWVSGYFAGHDAGVRGRTALSGAAGAPPAPAAADGRTLTVLFASETGNSEGLAKELAAQAKAIGLNVQLNDMADYKTRRLKDEQDLLLIASTHGEGDPPQGAADIFEFLEGRKAPRLEHVRFSVLALGDSTYERYCEAGRRLDRRLEDLGARRLHPRTDCDVDYEEPAAAWIAAVLPLFAPEALPGAGRATAAQTNAPELSSGRDPSAAVVFHDKRHPFRAPILDNFVLTGRGSSKETRHVEVSLAGSGLRYDPGDALGLQPRNDPAVVEALLNTLKLTGSATLAGKSGPRPLGEALEADFEVTVATPRFLQQWADVTASGELKSLLGEDQLDARSAFLRGHQVIDIVRAYPAPGVAPAALTAGLRPLQPRLYSIASSPLAVDDEAHLTVSTVHFTLHGAPRFGGASGQLAHRLGPDDTLPVYVQANPHFRLPEPERPIILIGAGTGVAPYRAFLQHREAEEATGRSWLLFGERNFRTDFLYQTEWQSWLRDRVLTRMDVAFSRDTAQKHYVQHRLLEHAEDIHAWIEDGASVYVCGDAARLAPDVHDALASIFVSQAGLTREEAEDRLRSLARDHRYKRDVY